MFLERQDKMYALRDIHKKSFHKKRKIAFAAVFLTGLSMAFSVESFADGPGDALGKAGNVMPAGMDIPIRTVRIFSILKRERKSPSFKTRMDR